ncbi:MAG: hypothetical protein AAGA30_17520, partial [Planctomycetota bacterium]
MDKGISIRIRHGVNRTDAALTEHNEPRQPLNMGDNVGHRFLATCEEHKDRIAVITADKEYAYFELASLVCQFAECLSQDNQFHPGTHVALRFEN